MHLNNLLHSRGRWQLLGLFLCSLGCAAIELVGVGSIMPFMTVASTASVSSSPTLAYMYRIAGFPSVQAFLIFWGVVVLVSLALVNVLTAITVWLGLRFGYDQQLELSRRLYRGYLHKSFDWHLSRHSANLAESLGRARALADVIYKPLVSLVARGVTALFLLVLLVALDAVVALTTTAVLLSVFGAVYFRCRHELRCIADQELQAGFRLATTLSDSFGALKHVQLRGCQEHYVGIYAAQIERLGQFAARRLLTTDVPRIAIHALANGAILALVIYLEATLAKPELLVPIISVYVLAGYRVLPTLQLCLSCLFTLEAGRPLLDAIWNDLGEVTEQPPERAITPVVARHNLSLRGVEFTYPNARLPVLQGCDLHIPVGSKVGIVGPTGCGKTTLIHLLVGLLQPTHGHLAIDDVPVAGASLRGWQRSIGLVPQDVFLADDSIGANIALGIPDSQRCPARLEEVARMASIHEFVASLPGGYATHVGERGTRLSGGQRQRIGLARALYHRPQVLVLDEATSSLDSGTEAELLRTLETLHGQVTMVVVAHRLTTVKDCDCIYVVGRGGVVAQGTYADLLRTCPEFQAIAPAGAA